MKIGRKQGVVRKLFETWVKIIFSPHDFFLNIQEDRSLNYPLVFALICRFLAISGVVIIGFLGRKFIVSFAPRAVVVYNLPFSAGFYWLVILISLTAMPVLLFASAVFLHMAVLVLGGKKSFKATFAVVAYSNAAVLFVFIPIAGCFFSFIYNVVLMTLGLKYVVRISALKAIMAVSSLILLLSLAGLAGTLVVFNEM